MKAITWGIAAVLLSLIAASCGSTSSSGQASITADGKPVEAKKASDGDDAKDLHNRAQQAVNRAEVCIAAVELASQDTSSPGSMASSLQQARGICEESKTYLATENFHGFSDQTTTLFASADEGKSATGAGLAYLDTQAPSKLADFTRHVQDAAGYFSQGIDDLNTRLSELGVAHVKK